MVVAFPDPPARLARGSARRSGSRGGRDLSAEPLAPLAHSADRGTVRSGAAPDRGGGVMDQRKIVEDGYEAVADRFGEWRAAIKGSPDDEWLDVLWILAAQVRF